MSDFTGFSAALGFLTDLAANNDKAFMDANKKRYKAELIEPAAAFVTAVGDELRAFAPQVQAVPKVNGSIFRMNRDVRFSKDKTPYKTHLDLWFFEGDKRGWGSAGFYFRMFPDQLILGGGMHQFPKPLLPRYQAAVAGPDGAALAADLERIAADGYEVGGEEYKRVPGDFGADHPWADLIRKKGLNASWRGPLPDVARSEAFVDWVVGHFKAVAPLQRWLADLVAAQK